MQVPQVNLLPPEVGAQRALNKTKIGVVIGLAALVVVLGLVYMMKLSEVSTAEEELESQEQTNASLQNQINDPELQAVVDKQADLQARTTAIAAALTGEVSFHRLLNELSIATPDAVGLNSLSVSRTGGETTASGESGSGAATPDGTGLDGEVTAAGTLQVEGVGSCVHPDTADWLDSIGSLLSVESLWADSSTRSPEEGQTSNTDCVAPEFSSQAELSNSIYSARSVRAAQGELP